MLLCFIATFTPLRKEGKNEKLNAWRDLVEI